MSLHVTGSTVKFTDTEILSDYTYYNTEVVKNADGTFSVHPTEAKLHFKTVRKPTKTGVMLVGWGGNNGSTLTAGILANKHKYTWRTRRGVQAANYFGSITQASTMRIGQTKTLEEVNVPLSSVVPMVDPNELVLGGWDCNSANLGDAVRRAAVLEVTLQDLVYDEMKAMKPLPAIFDLAFVAENQEDRADNVIPGTKKDAVAVVR
jgi:myo-inositol-1-phosphate synthase